MSDIMDEVREAVLEIALKSRSWRLDNLYMILSEEDGIIPFVARPEQREFRENQHNCNFIPKARKLGMSTEIVIENMDSCIFEDNFHAAIIDLTEPDAWDKLGMAKLAWEHGPKHPNPEIAHIWEKIQKKNPLLVNSNSEMKWSNGSRFEAGISFTGGTLQALHWSEAGPTASQKPHKAAAIKRGSMNAVVQSGRKTIETTMEGPPFGICYDFFKLALNNGTRTDLDVGEWRLHYYSWLRHPSYRLKNRKPTDAETVKYFAELSKKYGDEFERLYGYREVPLDRQAWYEMKKKEQKDEMWQQFPTVIEECVRTSVAGQIYPEMVQARAHGRVRDFAPDKGIPICTYWDLGSGVNLSGWLIQKSGKDINVLAWTWGEAKGASFMADVIRHWETEFGQITCNFLPHDADADDKGSGKTYRAQLVECMIPSSQIKVVPRIHSVWVGIEEVRKRIPRMWFHSRCDVPVEMPDGTKLPGGVGRLEGYRMTPASASGLTKGVPFGDCCSHTADSLRTFAEADWRNLIDTLGYAAMPGDVRLSMPGMPGYNPWAEEDSKGSGAFKTGPRYGTAAMR